MVHGDFLGSTSSELFKTEQIQLALICGSFSSHFFFPLRAPFGFGPSPPPGSMALGREAAWICCSLLCLLFLGCPVLLIALLFNPFLVLYHVLLNRANGNGGKCLDGLTLQKK